MRTLLLCLIVAAPTFAEERNWTISTGTYSADGELIEVRGNMVYLRMQGKVEQVPIERLSGADQQYLSSLRLKPLMPAPASDESEALPTPRNEFNAQPPRDVQLTRMEMETAFAEPGELPMSTRVVPRQEQPGPAIRRDQYNRPPARSRSTSAAQSRSMAQQQNSQNPNARRYAPRPPQQQQNQANNNNNRSDSDESRRGLFGRRRGD